MGQRLSLGCNRAFRAYLRAIPCSHRANWARRPSPRGRRGPGPACLGRRRSRCPGCTARQTTWPRPPAGWAVRCSIGSKTRPTMRLLRWIQSSGRCAASWPPAREPPEQGRPAPGLVSRSRPPKVRPSRRRRATRPSLPPGHPRYACRAAWRPARVGGPRPVPPTRASPAHRGSKRCGSQSRASHRTRRTQPRLRRRPSRNLRACREGYCKMGKFAARVRYTHQTVGPPVFHEPAMAPLSRVQVDRANASMGGSPGAGVYVTLITTMSSVGCTRVLVLIAPPCGVA